MYLSTIFLSDIDNGVEHAITKCNEEFLKRFGSIQDYISASITTDFSGKVLQMNCQCDEIMALWDVFKDFKDEIFLSLPVIEAMKRTRDVRNEMGGAFGLQRMMFQ